MKFKEVMDLRLRRIFAYAQGGRTECSEVQDRRRIAVSQALVGSTDYDAILALVNVLGGLIQDKEL